MTKKDYPYPLYAPWTAVEAGKKNSVQRSELHKLETYGVLYHRFSKNELSFLHDEADNIKSNFDVCDDASAGLVGHIQKQYYLSKDCTAKLNQLFMPLVRGYGKENNFLASKYTVTNTVEEVGLVDPWINFQEKYEYNPVHNHTGLFSFVLWLNIPYTREDEDSVSFTPPNTSSSNGNFELLYNDTLGAIKTVKLPMDSTFENSMILFPAQMCHCVYPFFTSDDYRISVAGNFFYI